MDLVAAPSASELESDPVGYMAIVLNRAKGWLAEAQSIDAVRETKAIAVGYESVIREKELAMDAELSATEIVRRCERRIGELVNEGQQLGTILSRGQHPDRSHGTEVQSPGDLFVSSKERKGSYVFADANPQDFDAAIEQAKTDGDLSRANLVRKVKGESKPKQDRSEWHRHTHKLNSDRILTSLAAELDGATSGLDLINPDDLDPDLVAEFVPKIRKSLRTINQHLRRVQQ